MGYGTGGAPAPSGKKKRSIAQMRKDNPDMVERVKARLLADRKGTKPDPSKPAAPLTPEEKRARAARALKSRPVAPGSPTTMRDIRREREAALALEFAPIEDQLNDQRALQKGREKAVGQWFGNYQADLERLRATQQQRNDTVTGQVQGLGEGSAALSAADASRVTTEMANDAAARGATADTTLDAQAIQAARSNQALNANFGSLLASQGLADDAFAAGRVGNAKQSELEARLRLLGDLGKIDAQDLSLAREKGSARRKYTADAVQRERDYGLALQHQAAETAAVGAEERSDIRAQRIDLIKAGINPDTMKFDPTLKPPDSWSPSEKKAAAELRFFNQHGYWPSTGKPKGDKEDKDDPTSGPGSLTPAEESKRISRVRTISSYFREGLPVLGKGGRVVKTISDEDEVKQYLLTVKGIDPLAVRIGAILADHNGKLTPKGIQAARKYGIHVKGNFTRAPTGSSAIPGVPQVT